MHFEHMRLAYMWWARGWEEADTGDAFSLGASPTITNMRYAYWYGASPLFSNIWEKKFKIFQRYWRRI